MDDDEAFMLTKEVEKNICKTISAIKINNPAIFDKNIIFSPKIIYDQKKEEQNGYKDDKSKVYKIENFLRDRHKCKNLKLQHKKSQGLSKNLIKEFQNDEKEDDFFELVDVDKGFSKKTIDKIKNISLNKNWIPITQNKEQDTFLRNFFSKHWWSQKSVGEKNANVNLYGFKELMKEEKVSEKKFRHQEVNGSRQLITYPRLIKGSLREKGIKKKKLKKYLSEDIERKKKAKLVKWYKKKIKTNVKTLTREIQKKTGIHLPIHNLDKKKWDFLRWTKIIEILKKTKTI